MCFGDEISDIIYLVKNEYSLKQNDLFVLSVKILVAHYAIIFAAIVINSLCGCSDYIDRIVLNSYILMDLRASLKVDQS